ncbi:MAG: N-acetylmuramoyl-L-alanine amidase [Alphaproteobacteria bacterium]|nr:N-acetylmuramoyl-L-alanine amidase [Alphaproteobacteria bacterium]
MATARRAPNAPRQGRVGRIGATARRAAALALLLAVFPGLGPGLGIGHAAKPGAAAVAEATGWRLGDFEAAQRLVVELTGPIEVKTFRLADPWRVVVDMPEIDGRRLEAGPPLQGGMIQRVRYGVLKPGTSRLVIDSSQSLRVRNAVVIEPRDGHAYRLVIDLEPDGTAVAAVPPPSPAPPAPTPMPAPAPVVAAPPVSTPAPPPLFQPPVQRSPVEAPPGPSLLSSLAPPAQAAPLTGGRLESAAVVVPIKPAAPREPKREDAKRVIVIDAGHGGPDPGAISLSGVYEKAITLGIAQEIERQLTMTGRYKVVLTRSDDTFIRLRERVAIARQAQADLFLSIHADSLANHSIGGMSIYTLSETASDREAEALATKENKADIIAGVDLRDETHQVSTILIDLAQRETKNLSATLAMAMIDEVGRDRRLLPQPHRFAGFAVLTAPDVPSVLIELGYLSNRTDEKELLDGGHRQRLGRGIVRALDRYFAGKERPRRS